MELADKIRANAEMVIAHFAEAGLAYDERSVEWLDGFIERQRERMSPDEAVNISQMLGCFLGECIIENFGGEWQQTEHGLGVIFSDGNAGFPLNKVEKQFKNGAEDSVLSFYQTIPVIFGGQFNSGDEENAG